MKIKLIKNAEDNDKVVGWKMIPENEEDYNTIAHIRNLSFFKSIKYNGRKMKKKYSYKGEDVEHLSWVTEEYQEEEKRKLFRR